MKTFIPQLILAAALTFGQVAAPTVQAQNTKSLYAKPFFECNLGYDVNKSHIKINNIPLYMRTVSHPEFGASKTLEDNVELGDRMQNIGLKVGEKVSFLKDKINFNLGAGVDFINRDFIGHKDYYTKEYITPASYSNNVYFSFSNAFMFNYNGLVRPKMFSELQFNVLKYFQIKAGYEAYAERVVLENGWNGDIHPDGTWGQWADSETNKKYLLAKNILVGTPYIAININEGGNIENLCGALQLIVGYTHLLNKETKESINLDYKNNWFFGFNLIGKVVIEKEKK